MCGDNICKVRGNIDIASTGFVEALVGDIYGHLTSPIFGLNLIHDSDFFPLFPLIVLGKIIHHMEPNCLHGQNPFRLWDSFGFDHIILYGECLALEEIFLPMQVR